MNATTQSNLTCLPSAKAHRRMLSEPGEPLFIAAWRDVLMIHFEVDGAALQREVPFELDLWNGRAFISVVAFTMRDMRPRFGGKLAALLFRPIATHHFLNVRTYVRHGGECGIHFMAEWLTNRFAVMLGPRTFGLPYRCGRISYNCDLENGRISGRVADGNSGTNFRFEARLTSSTDFQSCPPAPGGATGPTGFADRLDFRPYMESRRRGSAALPQVSFQPCVAGSLDEWFMERYIAFNSANRIRRFFRVWHPPWPQQQAQAKLDEKSLLTKIWPWFEQARMTGANYSPGFDAVWMGRPHRVP